VPSVIIPAHNEERLIGEVLRAVLAEGVPDLEVIVVPNGCRDRTAEVARPFAPAVTVVEVVEGGKTNAINRGEAVATRFPRVFLDGDIVLEPGALRAVLATLGGEVHLASPPPRFDTSESSRGVRLFYRALRYNAYFGTGAPNGSGTFATTVEGRSRWGEFPAIIADDSFVQCQFEPHERKTSPGPGAIVRAPRTFASLRAVQKRTRLGGNQLATLFPGIVHRRSSANIGRMVKRMLVRPWEWPALVTWAFVRATSRRAADRALKAGEYRWSQDQTARG
jgi:glycosyltransferase involved in cell wall biosynthesis